MKEDNIEHIYHPKPVVVIIRKIAFIFSLGAMATAILIGAYYTRKTATKDFSYSPKVTGISRFSSLEQMQAYLSQVQSLGSWSSMAIPMTQDLSLEASDKFSAIATNEAAGGARRASQTNVQVLGIDEPDVVKTDGKYIYWAGEPGYYLMEDMPAPRGEIMPAPASQNTKIISVFPPESLEQISEITDGTELILYENILIAIDRQNPALTAYDVSDKTSPRQIWRAAFSDATFTSLRLIKDAILVVSQKNVNYRSPCPIPLLEMGGARTAIACDSIYHIRSLAPSETTYTALKINAKTGQISDTATFLGSSQNTTVYVSQDATYIVLANYLNQNTLMLEYFTSESQNVLPEEVIRKIKTMAGLNISLEAKFVELQVILESYKNSLGADQARELETKIINSLATYTNQNIRELHKSEVIKIDNQKMAIVANTSIPGNPLNQFSLDEYGGNLRLATTIGQSFLPGVQTVSDVYILNDNLDILGKVTDLGRDERIYAVRFLRELAYVVTFKEIDPFFVLDLTDPKNPSIKGELKIPGYSSYLHPVGDKLILGVGKEDQYIKLSLFNVADPQNPTEISSLLLDEFYSESLYNHHAFLHDPDNQLVFIPGSRGGYVVSYAGQRLALKKAFSEDGTKRGLYLDQYFYLLSMDRIRVFGMDDWQEINRLELN